MKNKFLLTLVVVITSVIGFSSGFVITQTLVIHRKSEVLASDVAQYPQNEVIEKIQTTDTVSPLIQKNVPVENKDVVKNKNSCQKPKKDYTDETYLNVGQDIPLDDPSYIPSDLVELDKDISKTPTCVKKDVSDALLSMFAAAEKDGYTIIVSSGFRNFETQKSIIDRETKNGNKYVSVAVAKPGYSEHQLGVAVDLTSKSIAFASAAAKFGDTLDSKWLEIHANEYGFIQSYPKGKEKITGYMYEPWHYRYVGIDNAKEIIKNNQTINQFLEEKNSTNKNTL